MPEATSPQPLRGTYVGNGRMLILSPTGARYYVPADDASFLPDMLIAGYIEPNLSNYILQEVRPRFVFVDVGASFGYFSVLAGRQVGPKGRVIAFEPNPEIVGYLRANMQINGLIDRCELHPKAAGREALRDRLLQVADVFTGNTSFKPFDEHYQTHWGDDGRETYVPVVQLSQELRHLKRIDFIKIDAEGLEFEILEDLGELLEARRLDKVVFDWNRQRLGEEDAESLLQLLRRWESDYDARLHAIGIDGKIAPMPLAILETNPFYPHVVMTHCWSN